MEFGRERQRRAGRTPMKLNWDEPHGQIPTCVLVDLYIIVGRGRNRRTWGYEVTRARGSGGDDLAWEESFKTRNAAMEAAEKWFAENQAQALADRYLGWFDNPHETEPAYDPKIKRANFDYYCPFCTETLWPGHDDMVTVSLGIPGDFRSYFYRAHKSCYERDSERVTETDSQFIWLIEAMREVQK